jgi:GDPmannose 4,6-dehydratase
MWRMVQKEAGADYVLATGKAHTVRQLIETAAACVNLQIGWRGEGASTEGVEKKSGRILVRVNPAFYRPADITVTVGNAAKAAAQLDWRPVVDFRTLVGMMIEADLARLRSGSSLA